MSTALNTLIDTLYASRNSEYAHSMTQYMRGNFPFLGIQAPQIKILQREFLRIQRVHKFLDWNSIDILYTCDEREFQYVAIDYLRDLIQKIRLEEFSLLEKYIVWKSWWDSVDILAPLIGRLVQWYPSLEEYIIQHYIPHTNLWIRRVSIIYQLQYKEQTNTEILTQSIIANQASQEFFINKAIGWALREYSKHNPIWVDSFLTQYSEKLHSLSIREARKYINKQKNLDI